MASWKKVLVSGSAGEFSSVTASVGLRVGNNQTISTTQAILTGSFTGSFRGDGSGLTGVSANFPSTPVSSLDPLDKFFIQDSADTISKYITYTDFLGDIAGTNLVADPTSPTSTTLKLANDISITTVTAGGSAPNNIGFIGRITGSNVIGTVESSSYALTSSFATTASFALNAVGGTLNISASAIGGQGGGNISINSPTALIVSGTLNEIEVSANNGILQIGLPNNVTIGGNLSVTGTTTTVSASSLLVTDKFIILSSGSTNNNDGGIIIQNAITSGTGSGYGFILDGAQGITAPRWGVTSSLRPTANDLTTPDEYMVSAKRVAGAPSNSTPPTYGGSTKGYGNIHIDETTGDIWIYSEQ
jgi:hypothetical protein